MAVVLVSSAMALLMGCARHGGGAEWSVSAARATNEPEGHLPTVWTDPRPAVRQFAEFARVANLYNFDPHIIGYEDRTNRNGMVKTIFETRTHIVGVAGGKVQEVISAMDSMLAPHDRQRQGMSKWYACTGTMTQAEAVAATYSILRALNETSTLATIEKAKPDFRPARMRLKGPDGAPVEVTPFCVIDFNDDVGSGVSVEFRMGSNGPAGLTSWWNNR